MTVSVPELRGVSVSRLLVLAVIERHAGPDGWTQAPLSELARIESVHRRAFQRDLEWLEGRGWVARRRVLIENGTGWQYTACKVLAAGRAHRQAALAVLGARPA